MNYAKKFLSINLTALFLTASSSVWAGFFDVSPGKSGAAFMRVALSARKLALGGGGTALTGADFVETNPAALYDAPAALQFSHLMYFDSISLNDAKFTFSVESSDSYGVERINNFLCLGLRSFSSDEDRRDMLTGIKTGSFGVNARSVFLSYAFLSDNYTGGLTVKNISESVDNNLSSAAAFDAGAIKDINENLSLGASVRNIGKKISESPLPFTLSAGLAYRGDDFTINGDIEKSSEENKVFSAGVEYPMVPLVLRGGLIYQDLIRPAAGIGVKHNNFILDYAFSFHKYLGQRHLFTLTAEF
ncbi:MAG: hypothetical protein CVU78_00900 [Elusimicrobia bacterium HGW-Elusimicrobia-2]|nr:MAG: hypothetical protein CVU78_00900 [Elusimicrobia bacterium HGW-Elusimicrobia-2]